MVPHLRQEFNDRWTADGYARLLHLLETRTGLPPLFRHNETPCFFPASLVERMVRYGRELLLQAVGNRPYLDQARLVIPPAYLVPNEAAVPLFAQVDFGLLRDANGEVQPRLIEIQGFPSLYAYQPVLSECYQAAYGFDPGLRYLLGGLTLPDYHKLLRRLVTGGHDPETVVLLEIDPLHQKTLADFVETEKVCGLRTVDLRDVRQEGRRLMYERDGRRVPIRRIYNRAIVDELERRGLKAPFDWSADLDVEWAGHPNWFFLLSKYTLPFFRHECVPATRFLDEAGDLGDLSRLVLKPLFSFAGAGVVVGPTRDDLARIPVERRRDYLVQERIEFAPILETPHGGTKVEVRVMYLWDEEPRAVTLIVRTGRGSQMGVDHNKGLAWVGASAGFVV